MFSAGIFIMPAIANITKQFLLFPLLWGCVLNLTLISDISPDIFLVLG